MWSYPQLMFNKCTKVNVSNTADKQTNPFDHFNTIKTIIAHWKLVAFELVRSATHTRPSGARALILQAINALHERGSGLWD